MIRKERPTIELYDKEGAFHSTIRLKKNIDLEKISEKVYEMLDKENVIDVEE